MAIQKPIQPRYIELHTPEGKVHTLRVNSYDQVQFRHVPYDPRDLKQTLDYLNTHYSDSFRSIHFEGDGLGIVGELFSHVLGNRRSGVVMPRGSKKALPGDEEDDRNPNRNRPEPKDPLERYGIDSVK